MSNWINLYSKGKIHCNFFRWNTCYHSSTYIFKINMGLHIFLAIYSGIEISLCFFAILWQFLAILWGIDRNVKTIAMIFVGIRIIALNLELFGLTHRNFGFLVFGCIFRVFQFIVAIGLSIWLPINHTGFQLFYG